MNNHSKCLLDLSWPTILGTQPDKGRTGMLNPIVTDKPPRRFGRKKDDDEDGNGPDPLNGEWDAVSPLSRVLQKSLEDPGRQELADDPAEVDVCGEISTKGDRYNLGCIRGLQGLEYSPVNQCQYPE